MSSQGSFGINPKSLGHGDGQIEQLADKTLCELSVEIRLKQLPRERSHIFIGHKLATVSRNASLHFVSQQKCREILGYPLGERRSFLLFVLQGLPINKNITARGHNHFAEDVRMSMDQLF